MAKTQVALEVITGILVKPFPARDAKGYTVYDFIVKTAKGEIKCSRFGDSVKEYLGRTIQFQAAYQEKYDTYTVKGDITETEITGNAEMNAALDATEAPENKEQVSTGLKKRTRKTISKGSPVADPVPTLPAKVAAETGLVAEVEGTVNGDLESVRAAAQEIFRKDAEFVDRTLGGHAEATAVAAGVQALQAIRATLFIEANKRDRVADMKTSKKPYRRF